MCGQELRTTELSQARDGVRSSCVLLELLRCEGERHTLGLWGRTLGLAPSRRTPRLRAQAAQDPPLGATEMASPASGTVRGVCSFIHPYSVDTYLAPTTSTVLDPGVYIL